MVAALVVIVDEDHDLTASEVLFVAGRKAIAATAEGEGGQAEPRERVNVLLALGPVDEPFLPTPERVFADKYGTAA